MHAQCTRSAAAVNADGYINFISVTRTPNPLMTERCIIKVRAHTVFHCVSTVDHRKATYKLEYASQCCARVRIGASSISIRCLTRNAHKTAKCAHTRATLPEDCNTWSGARLDLLYDVLIPNYMVGLLGLLS